MSKVQFTMQSGVIACAVLAALSANASALNISTTWTGTSSTTFSDVGNWNNGAPELSAIPPAAITDPMAGDYAMFGTNAGSVLNQPTLTANHGLRRLQFDGSGWTIGGTATLYVSRQGGGIITTNISGTNTINANVSVGTRDSAVAGFNIAGTATDGVLRLNGTIGRFADNSGGGAVVKTGGGTLALATTGGTVNGWNVSAGTIKIISGTGGFGAASNVALTVGNGTYDVNGNSINAGSFAMSSATGTLTNSNETAATFSVNAGQGSNIAGKISGALAMTYGNNGSNYTFVLSNPNSDYTGATRINAGSTLSLSASAPLNAPGTLGNGNAVVQLGATSGTPGVSRTSRLLTNGSYSVGRDVNVGSTNDTKSLGAAATAGAGSSTFSGTINLGYGTNAVSALNLTAPIGHQVNFTGNLLEVTAAGNTTLGAVKKVDLGTVRLTGDNTFAGGTTVEAGALLVDNATGSGTGTSLVTVLDAATLGGFGAVSGSVTLDGTLLPTDASNAFNIGGTLTVDDSSKLDLVSLTALNPALTYTVVTYGTLAGSFSPSNILNTPVTHNVSFDTTGLIQLVPVPEPASLSLAALAMTAMLRRRRA